jgi:hypothetical protein
LNSNVETPAISITLNAAARSSPGSAFSQTIMASAAQNVSTIMPAAATSARCHLPGKPADPETSIYGTGINTIVITPASCTSAPPSLAA